MKSFPTGSIHGFNTSWVASTLFASSGLASASFIKLVLSSLGRTSYIRLSACSGDSYLKNFQPSLNEIRSLDLLLFPDSAEHDISKMITAIKIVFKTIFFVTPVKLLYLIIFLCIT